MPEAEFKEVFIKDICTNVDGASGFHFRQANTQVAEVNAMVVIYRSFDAQGKDVLKA